jgi:uracil-DNA glycosylase family 4
MFLGEAPGRQGGDRTRVPFSGDQSGRNFNRFIASINLPREELFITNAVLCNPRKESGANRKPTEVEIANCSGFLRRQIELIDPPVIVTLGAVSLAALRRIEYHDLTLKEAAGQIYQWNGRWLVPVYHPSPQVLASHRREAAQLQDYQAIARALRRG